MADHLVADGRHRNTAAPSSTTTTSIPTRPKGGTLNSIASGTFDSFNPYIVQGTPAAGLRSFGGGLLYDTLMEQSTTSPAPAIR